MMRGLMKRSHLVFRWLMPLMALMTMPAIAQAQPTDLDPQISDVVTGGWWVDGEESGYYPMVIYRSGWENLHSVHYIQWKGIPRERGESWVRASLPVEETNVQVWISTPRLEYREGEPVFVLEQINHMGLDIEERILEVHPGRPGEYRVFIPRNVGQP